jgi:hypothetical protein
LPEHVASRRVMAKIGMSHTGDHEHDGKLLSFYAARKASWAP